MKEKLRMPFDRRSGEDRRKIYNLAYGHHENKEKRSGKERRSGIERRREWIRETQWSSVLKPNLKDTP